MNVLLLAIVMLFTSGMAYAVDEPAKLANSDDQPAGPRGDAGSWRDADEREANAQDRQRPAQHPDTGPVADITDRLSGDTGSD